MNSQHKTVTWKCSLKIAFENYKYGLYLWCFLILTIPVSIHCHPYCFTEERKSSGFQTTRGWVNNDRTVISERTLSLKLKSVDLNDWKRRQTSLIFICKLQILNNLGFHLKMARNWGTQESSVHFPHTWQSGITQYLLGLDVECIWSSHLDVT